ncbi:MAG: alpha/beta hydrolase-fold protein [Verrucomicrobia bacterium]|nr:alpha/beta hydrolase-fold protein [Verrucomicrobiota bacterium]MDA1065723.1 alpha/beta hydrolase-fold protein [Verrucomicrobiota bacterium]
MNYPNNPSIFAFFLLSLVALQAAPNPDDLLGPDSKKQEGVPQGKVIKYVFENSLVFPGTKREYFVYVPAQYDASVPAALMVFQDGKKYQDPNNWFRVPVVFDNLIHKGDMPVTIALLIDPGSKGTDEDGTPIYDRSNRSREYDAITDRYSEFLIEEIIPEVARNYKLTNDPKYRAICGTSSGAICAFTAAWLRPDYFSKVLSGNGTFVNILGGHQYPSMIRSTPAKPIRVFIQDGSNDLNNQYGNWFLANQQMVSSLEFKGYDVKAVWGTGSHNAFEFGPYLPHSLRWLWRDHSSGNP